MGLISAAALTAGAVYTNCHFSLHMPRTIRTRAQNAFALPPEFPPGFIHSSRMRAVYRVSAVWLQPEGITTAEIHLRLGRRQSILASSFSTYSTAAAISSYIPESRGDGLENICVLQ